MTDCHTVAVLVGKGDGKETSWSGEKAAVGVSTGHLWFSSESPVRSDKPVKVLPIINRCRSRERGEKIKPIIKLICN